VVCRVRRAMATLDGALRNVVGALLSLPTIESEMYSLSVRNMVPTLTSR
jgi:hypothetical protein